ncbi:FG-GAP-like repeat-containing protein [Nanoarchaeota archaeon]
MNKKLLLITVLFLVLCGAASYADTYRSYIHTSSGAGSIDDGSEVQSSLFTGAMVYTYPIAVPPGTRGLTPVVGLSYSSSAHNSYPGAVGSGWSLTESYITRDVKNTPGTVNDDKYILVLNGQNYDLEFESDGRYHTKIETYMHITPQVTTSNLNGLYFVVKTKDGTRYRFGYNQNSEQVSNEHTYTWRLYLDEVEDTFGNKITYNYVDDLYSGTGSKYISDIRYNTGQERRVSFSYEPLPNTWPIYDNGNKVESKGRVAYIFTYANNQLVKRYDIDYIDIGPRSYISSITERGSDSFALPPTTFEYSGSKGWERSAEYEAALPDLEFSDKGRDGGVRLVDVNKDGMTDILQGYLTTRKAYIQQSGPTFVQDLSWRQLSGSQFIDEWDEHFDFGVRIADFNADGYPDILRGHRNDDTGTNYRQIWENTGSGWTLSAATTPTNFAKIEEPFPDVFVYSNEGTRLVDLNGDRRVDLIKAKGGGSSNAWLQTGGVWNPTPSYVMPSNMDIVESDSDDEGVRFVDINADGLVDLYSSSEYGDKNLWLNDGESWVSTAEWDFTPIPNVIDLGNDDDGVRLADINGDGLVDFIRADKNFRYTYINDGKDFVLDSDWDAPDNAEFVHRTEDNEGTRLVDINGDGMPDIIRMRKLDNGNYIKRVWLNIGKPVLMKKVTNPMGGVTHINYNSSTSYDNQIGFNQWVVSSISKQNFGDAYHDYNFRETCVPQECPAGYESRGVEYVSGQGQRTCDAGSCGTFALEYTDVHSWANHDYSGNAWYWEDELVSYDNFQTDKCYRVVTWSDNDIESVSSIVGEDTGITDSAMALGWEMTGTDEQPWGGNCELAHEGELMDGKSKYLIDGSENGDNFETADNLGGSWTGYCMPFEDKCSGYSDCMTDCYGHRWSMYAYANSQMPNTYADGDPDHEDMGACTADEEPAGTGYINYLDFQNSKQVGIEVYSATYTPQTQIMSCFMPKVKRTTYSYAGGLYDHQTNEFRGWSHVNETLPDGTIIRHRFHQDEAKKGLEEWTFVTEDGLNYMYTQRVFLDFVEGNHFKVIQSSESVVTAERSPSAKTRSTHFGYDQYGNVIEIEHIGDPFDAGDDYYEYIEYVYNPNDWIVASPMRHYINGPDDVIKKREVRSIYDGQTYGDAPTQGVVTRKEYWLNTGTDPYEEFTYTTDGNVDIHTDMRGYTTDFDYDTTGTFVTRVENALNQDKDFTYDLGTGNLLTEIDWAGHVTGYQYDTNGRKIKTIRPYDSTMSPTEEIVYSFDGVPPELVIRKLKDGSGTYDEYVYHDGFGNVQQAKKELEGKYATMSHRYDVSDKVMWVTIPYFDTASNFVGFPDFTNRTEYEYDGMGRQIVVRFMTGEQSIAYDPWEVTVTDARGHDQKYHYDAYGRVVQVKEYNVDGQYDTYYEYDVLGNLAEITDEYSNQWIFTHDSLGRKVMSDDPDVGSWTYDYDAAGNLVQQVDARGFEVNFTYDALGRLDYQQTVDGYYDYVYDTITPGTLYQVQNADFVKTLMYDNRLRNMQQAIEYSGGPELKTVWSFDSMDRVTGKTQRVGTQIVDTITYTYDGSKLNTISNVLLDVVYNAMGLVTARDYQNGLVSVIGYDEMMRVESITTGTLQDLGYTYDLKGNVQTIIDQGVVDTYQYDWLDRLTSVSGGQSLVYSYDRIGNMLSVSGDSAATYDYTGSPVVHGPAQVS